MVALGALWIVSRPEPAPPRPVFEAEPVAAVRSGHELAFMGTLTVKRWEPSEDLVLVCENYGGLLPMRPADLWLDAPVSSSGRVVVTVQGETANSTEGLGDWWGVMVDGRVVAQRLVGVGDERHRVTETFVIDGLEPGVQRLDIAHRSDRGGTANLFVGPRFGPAVMQVWS